MKILTKPSDIRQAVKDIKPNKVAVAFVGIGWDEYCLDIREIIVQPTAGTNPKAVLALAKKLDWDNIFFLDKLHSKIYIGENSALLGSCNLSKNGMDENGSYEAAVLIDEADKIKELDIQYEKYKVLAKRNYPSKNSKLIKIKEMSAERRAAIRSGYIVPESQEKISDFEMTEYDRIHICPYVVEKFEVDEGKFHKLVPEAGEEAFDEYFSGGTLNFLETDDINEGDWVLCWHSNSKGYPVKNAAMEWMYVSKVVNKLGKDAPYTKVAGQIGKNPRGSEPFCLDKPTRMIIKEVLLSKKYPELLFTDPEKWKLKPADKVTPDFIKTIQAMAQKKASKPKT